MGMGPELCSDIEPLVPAFLISSVPTEEERALCRAQPGHVFQHLPFGGNEARDLVKDPEDVEHHRGADALLAAGAVQIRCLDWVGAVSARPDARSDELPVRALRQRGAFVEPAWRRPAKVPEFQFFVPEQRELLAVEWPADSVDNLLVTWGQVVGRAEEKRNASPFVRDAQIVAWLLIDRIGPVVTYPYQVEVEACRRFLRNPRRLARLSDHVVRAVYQGIYFPKMIDQGMPGVDPGAEGQSNMPLRRDWSLFDCLDVYMLGVEVWVDLSIDVLQFVQVLYELVGDDFVDLDVVPA